METGQVSSPSSSGSSGPPSNASSTSRARGKRMREKLRDYYGLEDDKKEEQPKRKDDIDGSVFEADKYFNTLLHSKNLADLLKTETQLQGEMRILDGELKTLVYENYNKFISATETIKIMKGHVKNMGDEMAKLSTNMDKISSYSDQINTTLATRRGKIGQLSSVHRLIKKLQFLVELPSRLEQAIKLESYTQAVKYWLLAIGILDRYAHITSFATIRKDCEKSIEKVKVLLRERMKNPKVSYEQIIECVTILDQLKEDRESLSKIFLDSQKACLDAKMNAIGEEKNSDESIPSLNKVILFDVVSYAKTYSTLFIEQSPVENGAEKLEDWGREIYNTYLANLRVLFAGIVETKHFIYILGAIDSDLSSILQQPDVPELSTKQNLNNVVDICVREHIEQVFNRLKNRVHEIIQEMGNTASETSNTHLSALCKNTAARITTEIEKTFEKLTKLFSPEYVFLQNHIGVFFQRILVKVQNFFLEVIVLASKPIENDDERLKINSKFVLCTARMVMYLETESIDKIAKLVNSLKYKLSAQEREIAEDMTINTPDLRGRLKRTAERLIRFYVQIQSDRLTKMLRKSMETRNWLQNKEPRSPRDALETSIIPDIRQTFEEILQIFEEEKSKNSSQIPRAHSKNRSMVQNDALFQKKVRLGTEIQFTSGAILAEVVKVSLKSFVEMIRMLTFGKSGYNQMQVDIYFLRKVLSKIIEEEFMFDCVNALLDEALSNSSERSLDNHKLDDSIIAKMCDEKVTQMFGSSEPSSTASSPQTPSQQH